MNNFKKGVCYNQGNKKWTPIFCNPITEKQEYIKGFDTEYEAIEKLTEIQIDFYTKHSYLLPKYIWISHGKFALSITYKFKNKWKKLYLGTFDTVQEAKQAKVDFISNLL